jgi:hypothetical protein
MLQRRCLGDHAEQVSGGDSGPFFDARLEPPRTLPVERRQVDAARQERAPKGGLAVAGEQLERTLRAVEDATEQPGTELDFQWPACVEHGLADLQARGVLVDLDRCALAVQSDDLSGERGLTHLDDVVQTHASEAPGDHDRSGNAPDLTRSSAHGVFASSPNVIS